MRRCWGGKHTSFDNLKKGVKVQELGKEGLKRIDKIGKDLIREGALLTKPTSYGLQISLNPRFSQEIKALIQKYFHDSGQ
ncbi:MAG: hypothetical protein HYT70_01960 [Candidatus Aenigmarchaeota archaeon]|nr:hypothetical protein [Candidatus Aenigmarchaeota archaeon]